MTYTDAQGRPELIAGDFLKRGTGSARTTSPERSSETRTDTQDKSERKPAPGR